MRNSWIALFVGIVFVIGLAWYGLETGFKVVFQAWLIGWLMWVAISIGALGMSFLQYAVRGAWGVPVIRLYQAASDWRTLLILLVTFVPIAIGMKDIFGWVEGSKAPWYLNPLFFVVRACIYFFIWGLFSVLLRRSSLKSDPESYESRAAFRANLGAPGIVVLFLTGTWASFDWLMSLYPGWTSSIYGFLFVIVAVQTAHSFVLVFLRIHRKSPPYDKLVNDQISRDLGNLLLVMLLLWAYFNFTQFLIYWSGDIPREIVYFDLRPGAGWKIFTVLEIVLGFFIPLLCLTAPRVKHSIKLLGRLSLWMVLIGWLDLYWMTTPAFSSGSTLQFSICVLAAFLAVGGLWRWAFARAFNSAPPVPVEDPRLKGVLENVPA